MSSLRLKVPAIENLAILQDQYDAIDLSDNEVKKLDGFPAMRRLSVLLVNNNHISKLGNSLGEVLTSLTGLILTNNRIAHLSEIAKLSNLRRLEVLSLLDNPVALKQHYRLYSIHALPSLKVLDYRKVSKKEREEARKLFKSPAGQAFLATIKAEGGTLQHSSSSNGTSKSATQNLTESQKAQIKRAIEAAKTIEEIDMIQLQLKTGTFVFEEEESESKQGEAKTSEEIA
eukprot:scaffold1931_cov215-Ochromonas_danica.AAC.31